MNSPLIQAEDLSVEYNNKIIWKSATFNINQAEFIVLLGPNGAGKTTLFKLILGLIKPASGSINVFGEQPKKGSSLISYFPQKRLIDDEIRLNAIEYVRLSLSGHKLGFSLPNQSKIEYREAYRVLDLVDARKFALMPLYKLSGGEQQKIFLAQALIQQPKLLLLDEPLANLDIKRETELIELIKDVVAKTKITVILITHDINPLLGIMDRIIYVANQKVVSGLPEEIITTKKLSELYNANIEVLKTNSGKIAVLGLEDTARHNHE